MKLSQSAVARVVNDFGSVELGDLRLRQRAQVVVEKMAQSPSLPLPAVLGTDAQVQGCYRLMNNEAVEMENLLAGHIAATAKRAEEAGKVLVLHDTTTCSFEHLCAKEIGYLQTGKAGFFLHPALVLDARGWRRPLGVIHAETIHRPTKSKRAKRGVSSKASGLETAKWTDKESLRWWRGIEASGKALWQCQEVIHIADREGDSFALMANMQAASHRFVIRVRVDRRSRKAADEALQWSTIKKIAAQSEGVLERDVPLSRRAAKPTERMRRDHPPRKARMARLQFSATCVVIPRPQYLKDPAPKHLELNLVHVSEIDPAQGEPPVQWLLYTTEPVATPEQVAQVVDNYRARWTIEEFNAALKTGCAYEARQFETRHALLAMLALSLPVACEILALRSRARSTPTAPATDNLSAQQLTVLRSMGVYPLSQQPSVTEALLAIAALGGHLRRNGPPGWKVLQRGMTLLFAYERGWAARDQQIMRGTVDCKM